MNLLKEFTFEAAHRLSNILDGHKCGRLYGHSFRVALYVEVPVDEHLGWVIDFADTKRVFKPIYPRLDHHNLNESEELENSTSETLTKWIWTVLKPEFPLLSKIVTSETHTSGCVCRGEESR